MPNKTLKLPANAPSPHKEMTQRVKREFAVFNKGAMTSEHLEKNILAILKEYDISDAMRAFDKE